MSITAIWFYWRNDTPSFVTWWSRLATASDTPTCRSVVIHGGQFTGGVHTPNQFVHEIVSLLPCSPVLPRHTLLIVYFFKELISSLTNATSEFSTLWLYEQLAHLHVRNTQKKVSNIASDEDIMENNYMIVMLWNLSITSHLIFQQCFFSSPEHNMLKVSYCDRSISGVCVSLRPWTIT